MSANHTNAPLTRRLAQCERAAHEVYNARELDESLIGSLIIAAAILDNQNERRAIPNYAMDLLFAARREHSDGSEASSAMLEEAIIRFERAMPVADTGDVLTYGESMFSGDEED
ncbi:hypothetical protein AGMMS49545_16440 [Betaproteobacteria bacterium]|nr:hypothetical protein AGMMS49545_16440 [Betaproteobacteria bacterium]GHU46345.1 hypothetical protein AGMMS50289_19550 [Betaproteobacteria bacterium]